MTEAEYKAALSRVYSLMSTEEAAPELKVLAERIQAYEEKHWTIALPTPEEAHSFRKEQEGLL